MTINKWEVCGSGRSRVVLNKKYEYVSVYAYTAIANKRKEKLETNDCVFLRVRLEDKLRIAKIESIWAKSSCDDTLFVSVNWIYRKQQVYKRTSITSNKEVLITSAQGVVCANNIIKKCYVVSYQFYKFMKSLRPPTDNNIRYFQRNYSDVPFMADFGEDLFFCRRFYDVENDVVSPYFMP